MKVKREKPNNIKSSSSSLQCQMKCMEYLGKVKLKSETEKPSNINSSSHPHWEVWNILEKMWWLERCLKCVGFYDTFAGSCFSVDGFKFIFFLSFMFALELDHSCKLREEDTVFDPPTKICVTRSIGALPAYEACCRAKLRFFAFW